MSDPLHPTLGRYEIIAELGEDELCKAYQARDTLLGRAVRLLVVHPRLTAGDPSLKRRLLQAVERLKTLSHPHLARVYGCEEIEGQICVAVEFVEGRTLYDLLQSGALSLEQVRQVLADVGEALDEVHRQGIVGLDIQPSRILLSPEGRAMLADLCLAHILYAPMTRTRERTLPVSPAYAAPEIARGERPTRASDLYALGVLLYEMLLGHPPFLGAESSILLAQMNQPPPPPSQADRRLPEAVDAVIAKALAKEPAARYATAAQMVADLEGIEPPRPTGLALPLTGRAPLLAGMALVVVIIGLVAWWALSVLPGGQTAKAPPILPSGAGILGTYEVTIPRQLCPGEGAMIRLAIHVSRNLSPDDLPTLPPPGYQASVESALFGSVSLCRDLWARLEAPDLEIRGPNAMRRIVRPSGVEWQWEIGCPEQAMSGERVVALQLFARQSEASGTVQDVLLKDIRFTVPVREERAKLPSAALGLGLAGVLALALWVAVARRRRKAR